MSSSAWIPLVTALTALAGGFLGALLQGTFSVRGWRRQTRYDAYVRFAEAEHVFHNAVIDALAAFGTQFFPPKSTAVLDAQLALGRAASLVNIAGPHSLLKSARKVVSNASSLVADFDSFNSLVQASEAAAVPDGYPKLSAWVDVAEAFETDARRVLGTS